MFEKLKATPTVVAPPPPAPPAEARVPAPAVVEARVKTLRSQAWEPNRSKPKDGAPHVFRKGTEFVSVHVDGRLLMATGEEMAGWAPGGR